MATSLGDGRNTMFVTQAMLEPNTHGKGEAGRTRLAIQDVTTGKDRGKEGDLLIESSAISKAKGIDERNIELPEDETATSKGKGKERDMLVQDSTIGKGKCEDSELPLKDATAGHGKAKENGVLMKGPGVGRGEGKESELLMEGPVTEKGKGKENGLPLADNTGGKDQNIECDPQTANLHEGYYAFLPEAKALFLDPQSGGFHKGMSLNLNLASALTTSSTPPPEQDIPRDLVSSPLTRTEEAALIAYKKTFDIMELWIRPQSATLCQVDLFCRLLAFPTFFNTLSPFIEELRWNRAIVEHPYNRMITSVLQCTAHLRPTDGVHHPSGVSVAPLPIPQYPPLPPGPAPAKPVVTTPTEKQRTKERAGITKLTEARLRIKLPFENQAKSLETKEATILGKMRAGVELDGAQVFADLMGIGHSMQYMKEKARLEQVGGSAVDMLAERQKTMAEKDGAPHWLLP